MTGREQSRLVLQVYFKKRVREPHDISLLHRGPWGHTGLLADCQAPLPLRLIQNDDEEEAWGRER